MVKTKRNKISDKPRSLWHHRMFVEEIAARIVTAMKEQDISLFELARKLKWEPAHLLKWIDGSLASSNLDVALDGTLRELVDIGLALGKRWTQFEIMKVASKEKADA